MIDTFTIPRTAMEVFEMLPKGTLCEVIDNIIYMSPLPTTNHQDILGEIFLELAPVCKKNNWGKVYLSPCDVYLDDNTSVVQPDLFFVKEGRKGIIGRNGIIGSPDLVIEILSSKTEHDKTTKFELYQRNSIPEYFIIDPDRKHILHYLLMNGIYLLQAQATPGQLNIKQLNLQIAF